MTNKHSFVTAHKAQYAVSTLCRHLKISRGWFYGFLASQDSRIVNSPDFQQRYKVVLDLQLTHTVAHMFR